MAERTLQRPRSGPVPIAGEMLIAHAIIEQHRVDEFIAECEEKGLHMRARLELLEFAQEFIARPLNAASNTTLDTKGIIPMAAAKPTMSAKALTLTASARECDNTFKKKKTKKK